MYDLRLSPSDLAAVIRFLLFSHVHPTFRVQIMDLDHNFVSNISHAVMDGQVSVNYLGDEATRSLELALFDPDYDLGFDTSEFTDGVYFLDRMVQVVAEFYVPEIARHIEVPIFTGPVSGFKRKKAIVNLKCAGKDVFARAAWIRQTLEKGTNQVEAMRSVLTALGETKFRFEATTTTKLSKKKVVDKSAQQTPWGWCRSTATNLGMRLYYDGEGYACLRQVEADKPIFTFRDKDGGTVLAEPDSDADYSRIANTVIAQGKASGRGKAPTGMAVVPTSSAISPTKLLRGGKPVYLGVTITTESSSKSAANNAAQRELEDRQNASVGTTFDSLPIFMLEEGDIIRLDIDGLHTVSRADTFSLGLAPGAAMPVGYNKLVAPVLGSIRRL